MKKLLFVFLLLASPLLATPNQPVCFALGNANYCINMDGSANLNIDMPVIQCGTLPASSCTIKGPTGNASLKLDTTGVVAGGVAKPALSSCGSSPSIVGSATSGKITIGSGSTTSCTATFAVAYANAPACVVTGNSTAITYGDSTSTTALTITSSADMAASVISYVCVGY